MIHRSIITKIVCLLLCGCFYGVAPVFAGEAAEKTDNKETDSGKQGVGYFQFAPAIGLEGYSDSYINEAKIYGDDKLVHVTDSYDMNASLWLIGQYVGQDWANSIGNSHFAPGMYMAVRAVGASQDVFDSFSAGLSFVWFRGGLSKKEGEDAKRSDAKWFQTINFSVGPAWHRTRSLADGIVEGQPLPQEYTGVEYQKEDEISWVVLVSGSLRRARMVSPASIIPMLK